MLAVWRAAAYAEDNPPPIPWPDAVADALWQIDAAAGGARSSYLFPGVMITDEYTLAAAEARDWIAAGEPDEIPPTVAAEMARSGGSATAAAALIVARAAAYTTALQTIRHARLAGKAAVLAITPADPDNPTDAEREALREAVELALTALDAIKPEEAQ